jgi:hypothetical protein
MSIHAKPLKLSSKQSNNLNSSNNNSVSQSPPKPPVQVEANSSVAAKPSSWANVVKASVESEENSPSTPTLHSNESDFKQKEIKEVAPKENFERNGGKMSQPVEESRRDRSTGRTVESANFKYETMEQYNVDIKKDRAFYEAKFKG